MYDQGQYTNNLYHQIDDEKVPIIIRNQPPLLYRIHREADWNPFTQLQIDHSEWTHEPQEKLWSQEYLPLQLDAKRVVYPPFMTERPYYVEPATEGVGIMIMGSAAATAQGGKSLYSKDLGASLAVRASSDYRNRALGVGINVNNVMPLRVQDFVYAVNTLFDFDPNAYLQLHQDYTSTIFTDGDINTVIGQLERAGLKGELLKLLRSSMESEFKWGVRGSQERKKAFASFGVIMMSNEFIRYIQQESQTNLFFFWICMPHASGTEDADANYDMVMLMISHYVLSGRWLSAAEIKNGDGYVQGSYVGGNGAAGYAGLVSGAVGAAVEYSTDSKIVGKAFEYYVNAVMTLGPENADRNLANFGENIAGQVKSMWTSMKGGASKT